MKSGCIKYEDIQFLPKLMNDYLFAKHKLDSFYNQEPNLKGFQNAINSRNFSQEKREILVDVLSDKYDGIGNSEKQKNHIELLKNNNTFTVTTGHQLCLFTGPLYFIYKILSVVKLAEQLKAEFPNKDFVPIYWMASEDHDFDEINHFFLHNKRFDFSTNSFGAVGDITPEFEGMMDSFERELGKGKLGKELFDLFENAYTDSTLSQGTFSLVHELLGDYGIVILNPDNKKLKVVFQPYIEQELQKQVGYNFVNNTSARLADQGYKTQVNARDINLFYLMPQLGNRVRIEKTKLGFKLADNSREFTENKILEDLKKYPERYSPNVILRPLYQEVVLPNLSYTGGVGELSYWFQLKDMFTDFEVTFPILMLRNSAIIFSKNNKKRLNKLGLNYSDLFLEISKLEKLLLKKHGTNQIDLNKGKESLKSLFIKIKEVAVTVNPALSVTSDATTTKALKLISKLEKKLERHEKLNLQTVLDQLYLVLEEVFPNGSFQERRTNFSEYYLEDGKEFFKLAYDKFEPLEFEISILNR